MLYPSKVLDFIMLPSRNMFRVLFRVKLQLSHSFSERFVPGDLETRKTVIRLATVIIRRR